MKEQKALVVTTEHKGVFFGYGEPSGEKTIILTNARMCVYWDSSVHGVLGLAGNGPSPNCKITPKVLKITLQGVTSIMECSEAATKAWESEPWA